MSHEYPGTIVLSTGKAERSSAITSSSSLLVASTSLGLAVLRLRTKSFFLGLAAPGATLFFSLVRRLVVTYLVTNISEYNDVCAKKKLMLSHDDYQGLDEQNFALNPLSAIATSQPRHIISSDLFRSQQVCETLKNILVGIPMQTHTSDKE